MLRQQLEAIRRELGEGRGRRAGGRGPARAARELRACPTRRTSRRCASSSGSSRRRRPPPSTGSSARISSGWRICRGRRCPRIKLDVEAARRILDEDHYGLEKVKDRIVEYIAVLSLKRDIKGPILCFVGPPGTGKTSLGRSIARALGRSSSSASRSAVCATRPRSAVIAAPTSAPCRDASSRVSARRGRRTRCSCSTRSTRSERISAAIPRRRCSRCSTPSRTSDFSDHYLEVPVDLSRVLFIATANLMDPVPAALRDRMEVIELPGLHARGEARDRPALPAAATARAQRRRGHRASRFPTRRSLALVERYTREAGVRSLERELGAVCRKIARRVAGGGDRSAPSKHRPPRGSRASCSGR